MRVCYVCTFVRTRETKFTQPLEGKTRNALDTFAQPRSDFSTSLPPSRVVYRRHFFDRAYKSPDSRFALCACFGVYFRDSSGSNEISETARLGSRAKLSGGRNVYFCVFLPLFFRTWNIRATGPGENSARLSTMVSLLRQRYERVADLPITSWAQHDGGYC